MLLFIPAEVVGAIVPNLDGLVALAPGGADAGLASTPAIQAAVDRGVPLLATVSDTEWPEAATTTSPPAAPAVERPVVIPSRPSGDRGRAALGATATAEASRRPSRELGGPAAGAGAAAERPSRSRGDHDRLVGSAIAEAPSRPSGERGRAVSGGFAAAAQPYFRRPHEPEGRAARARWGLYAPLLLVVVAAAAVNYRMELGLGDLALSKLHLGGAPRQAVAPGPTGDAPPLVPHAVDSLPFVVQVSAWTSLAPALESADALEGAGFLPIVSPLHLGTQLWYRVYVGPVATQDGSDSLRSAVRAAGFDRPLTAAPVLAPLSVTLQRVLTPGAARAERARLRAAGIPAFVLGLADGSYQLLAGAYQRADQAAYLDSLLTSTGRAGQLGPRVGFRP
jgi:hypothetical protein